MAGRHREQILLPYRDDDGAGAAMAPATPQRSGRPRWKAGVLLVVAALAVPATVLVVIGVALYPSDEPATGGPQSAPPPVAAVPPRRVPPRVYPTYGEFVPPVSATPTATGPGVAPPASRRTARPSTSPTGRRCPNGWKDVPPLADWCKRNGYSTD